MPKKELSQTELRNICYKHSKWLKNPKYGTPAVFKVVNLSRRKLTRRDLRRAEFYSVDLLAADLSGACFEDAFFGSANLMFARAEDANFHNTIAAYANFTDADLNHTNCEGANFTRAIFTNTRLVNANLCNANLYQADLRGAWLHGTELKGATLDFAALPLSPSLFEAHLDDDQIKTLAYHLVKAGLQSKYTSTKTKRTLRKLIKFANESHVTTAYNDDATYGQFYTPIEDPKEAKNDNNDQNKSH